MLVKIQSWINRLAVKIPKPSTGELKISENRSANLNVHKDSKNIKPEEKNYEYSLNDLADQVTKNNLHREYDTGKPVGKEIW